MQHNLFSKVHEPLRLALLNTCLLLSKEQEFDVTQATATIKKVNEVLRLFKAQVKHEGLYILPLVFEYEPSVWDAYTREHHKAMNLAGTLESLVQAFNNVSNKQEQQHLLHLLAEAFNEFMLFNYRHMDDEEEVLSELFLRYYKHDVIIPFVAEMEILPMVFEPTQKKVFATANAA